MNSPESPVQLAVIGAAHGIRGEVKVKSFTSDPTALGDYGPLRSHDGRIFTVSTIRPVRNGVVVRFKEIADRDAAEGLAGTQLFIGRAALPDDLDEDEFYHADLIGLTVRDRLGETIGTVTAIHDFGAGDVVEVRSGKRAAMMVPFSVAAIPEVHVGEGFIVIDLEAAGLVGTDEDDEAEPGE